MPKAVLATEQVLIAGTAANEEELAQLQQMGATLQYTLRLQRVSSPLRKGLRVRPVARW